METLKSRESECLNPYSIGIWSATCDTHATEIDYNRVLILILLEYGLRLKSLLNAETKDTVLILILLEYGLRHFLQSLDTILLKS